MVIKYVETKLNKVSRNSPFQKSKRVNRARMAIFFTAELTLYDLFVNVKE